MLRYHLSNRPLHSLILLAALVACTEPAPAPGSGGPATAGVEQDPPVVEVMEGSGAPCTFVPAAVALAVDSMTTIHPAGGCARVRRKVVSTWEGSGPAPAGIGPRGCAAQEGLAT